MRNNFGTIQTENDVKRVKRTIIVDTGVISTNQMTEQHLRTEMVKPQMNAPSRASGGRIHVCPWAYVSMHSGGHDADERIFNPVTEFGKIIHRKERKAHQWASYRPLCFPRLMIFGSNFRFVEQLRAHSYLHSLIFIKSEDL
jgi:hypothetical protein